MSCELTRMPKLMQLRRLPPIESESMTPAEIMRDLARDDIFPKAAMAAASEQRDKMAPVFVELVDRLGRQRVSDMWDAELIALIPIFHLLGEWQEPRAYRPLLHMLRRPTKALDHLLGDAVTETSFRVIAGTFDGDLKPLFEAILDLRADDFARSSLMSALVLIADLHPDQRPAIEEFIRTFRTRHPKASPDVLMGWTETVSDLGLEDLTEEVRELFDKGVIPTDYCDFSHFLEDLQATRDAQGASGNSRYETGLITDSIAELSKWHCYTDAFFEQQKTRKVSNDLRVAPWTEILKTPAPPAGRNDPCPCGSGKKFKKCCLQ
jgi:hypothetical protein